MNLGRAHPFPSPKKAAVHVLARFMPLLLMGAVAHTAHADDLYSLSLEELQNVKVAYSSLLPTNQLQAGSTVDVVTQQQWQLQGARRTLEAVAHLPATVVLPMHIGAEALAIRGYGSVSAYSGTSLQWDGVPLNDLFANSGFINLPDINLDTLDKIELIRGPGSALFGSDAFHGALSLKAFDSESDLSQISAHYSSNEFYSAGGRWSAPAFQGSRVHLSAASSGQGDQASRFRYNDPWNQQPVSNQRANDYNADTITLKISSDMDQPWSYGGGLYVHHYDANDFSGLGTAVSGANDLGSANTEFGMAQFHVTRQLNSTASLEMQAYAWQTDTETTTYLQRASNDIERRKLPREQQRQGGKAIYRDRNDMLNTHWAWATGVDQLDVIAAERQIFDPTGALIDIADHPAAGANRHITYSMVEADTGWSDDTWHAVYGGRYDDYSDVGSHFSPRLGLVYLPLDDTSIKLLYGNAFRAPSALEINGAWTVEGNPDLDPEILDSYELVVMHQSRQWHWQGEIFHSLWRKAIVTAPIPDNPAGFRYANYDRSVSNGVALGVERIFFPWLLAGKISYAESKNQTSDTTYGMFPTYIVDWSLGYYSERFGTDLYLNQRYYSHANDVLESESGFATESLPVYWRTDLTLTHHVNLTFDVIASVRNLFDRENRLPSPMGSRGGIPDERGNVSLGFRYFY